MRINNISTPSFKALVFIQDKPLNKSQLDVTSKLIKDREYIPVQLVSDLKKNGIDIYIKSEEDSMIDISLKQNVGTYKFTPVNNKHHSMVRRFDTDDALIMQNISKFIDDCKEFTYSSAYDNIENFRLKNYYAQKINNEEKEKRKELFRY